MNFHEQWNTALLRTLPADIFRTNSYSKNMKSTAKLLIRDFSICLDDCVLRIFIDEISIEAHELAILRKPI